MHALAEFVDTVEAAGDPGVVAGNHVAVVGPLFARGQARGFADDLIPLDDLAGAVGVLDHPFPAQQRHGAVGAVANRDVVHEGVGLVGRQGQSAVVMAQAVEAGGQPRQFK